MNISLKQGLVSIALKPGNTVTLQQVRKAIKDDAFTPKDARVVVAGELEKTANGRLAFKVNGTNETYPVSSTAHASWDKKTGQQLFVTGLISAPANRNEPGNLEITEASAPPAVHKEP